MCPRSRLLTPRESKAWLTLIAVALLSVPLCNAITVPANSVGLYNDYYNSGFSSTPLPGLPNYAALTPANSSFAYNATGNFGNPQQSSTDTYCGGVYRGYLYITQAGLYIVGAQSKDGFNLTLNGYSVASNSNL